MPLPIPSATEDKESFIKRFMSDEKMIVEYPEEKQRMAIAEEQWASVDKYGASNYQDGCVMLSGEIIKPTEDEQEIKVFPKGKFFIQKYGKEIYFDENFFNQISSAYNSDGLSKPKIDKDHEFKISYGDINGYNIKDDGMYFKVKLNPKGVGLIKGGEYNYISPAWGRTTDTGKNDYPNRLLAISLVNFPALEGVLPSLRDQLRLSKFEIVEKKEEVKMELYILANELGLNKDASPEAIHTEVKTLKAKLSGYETENKDLKTSVKSAEDTALKLSKEIKEIKDSQLKTEATEAVRKWIELGKTIPAVQDIVINRYILNKEDTIKEFDLIPEKVYLGKQSQNGDTGTIDAETEKLMLKAGLNPKDKEDVTIFLSKRKGGK